jgi:hypothetical protein
MSATSTSWVSPSASEYPNGHLRSGAPIGSPMWLPTSPPPRRPLAWRSTRRWHQQTARRGNLPRGTGIGFPAGCDCWRPGASSLLSTCTSGSHIGRGAGLLCQKSARSSATRDLAADHGAAPDSAAGLRRCGARQVPKGLVRWPPWAHTAEVTGSIPVAPTRTNAASPLARTRYCQHIVSKKPNVDMSLLPPWQPLSREVVDSSRRNPSSKEYHFTCVSRWTNGSKRPCRRRTPGKAVEAAALAVVSPVNNRATLGTVIRDPGVPGHTISG